MDLYAVVCFHEDNLVATNSPAVADADIAEMLYCTGDGSLWHFVRFHIHVWATEMDSDDLELDNSCHKLSNVAHVAGY
jgi:hypothetical protein